MFAANLVVSRSLILKQDVPAELVF